MWSGKQRTLLPQETPAHLRCWCRWLHFSFACLRGVNQCTLSCWFHVDVLFQCQWEAHVSNVDVSSARRRDRDRPSLPKRTVRKHRTHVNVTAWQMQYETIMLYQKTIASISKEKLYFKTEAFTRKRKLLLGKEDSISKEKSIGKRKFLLGKGAIKRFYWKRKHRFKNVVYLKARFDQEKDFRLEKRNSIFQTIFY